MQAVIYGPRTADLRGGFSFTELEYTSDAFSHIGQGVRMELGGASPTGDRSVIPGPEPADPSSSSNPRPRTAARAHDAAIPRRVAARAPAARFVS